MLFFIIISEANFRSQRKKMLEEDQTIQNLLPLISLYFSLPFPDHISTFI